SQVQRYLSGKSVKEMQLGLLFNGLLKVPMQFFILLVGIMVFVFYQFNQAPLNFNPNATEFILNSEFAEDYKSLQKEEELIFNDKREHIISFIHSENADAAQAIILANEANTNIRNEAKSLIAKAAEKQ